MRMKQLIVVLWIPLILASACSKEEKKPQTKATESRRLSADRHPDSNPMAGLSTTVIDTLRAKRRIYNVTRDEYWDDKGGVLGNQYFDVWYPPGRVTVTHGMYALEELMIARRFFHRTFGVVPDDKLTVVFPPDMTTYLEWTQREWWYYATVSEDSVVFQPVYVLVKRGLGPIAISHEYSQWAMERLSRKRAPRWFVEGMASVLSDEGLVLLEQLWEFDPSTWQMSPEEIERVLKGEEERQPTRIAYYHSFKMIKTLESRFGLEPLTQFIIRLGNTDDLDAVSREVFNISYRDLLTAATRYEIDRKE